MNRHQSDKLKRRAALAAILSITTFLTCLAGMFIADRAEGNARSPDYVRRLYRPLLGELANAKDADQQQLLQQLVIPGGRIIAAAVVGRDLKIRAALPGRSELVGASVAQGYAPSGGRFGGTLVVPVPPVPPSPAVAVPFGARQIPITDSPRVHVRMRDGSFRDIRPSRRYGRADDLEDVQELLRERMAQSPSIGSAAYRESLLREPLTNSSGDDIGWLFVLPREPRNYEGAREAIVPILGITMAVSFFLYAFSLPWWVYLDAKSRTTKAIPLALFVFLTNFLGWLTYLVIRPDTDRLCPTCDSTLEPGFRLCPVCGWSGSCRCHACGRPARADWRFCPFCEAARPDVELTQELTRGAGSPGSWQQP